jgi:CBS domain-containing protein
MLRIYKTKDSLSDSQSQINNTENDARLPMAGGHFCFHISSKGGDTMKATDIMSKSVISVTPLTPVRSLAKVLTDHHISGVPVVDRKGRLRGVVTEADIVSRKGKSVRAIMTKGAITVTKETPIEEIAKLMTARRVKRLPVLQDGKVIGIVSRADIVRSLAMGAHVSVYTPIYDL